jgi:hypothetical protein
MANVLKSCGDVRLLDGNFRPRWSLMRFCPSMRKFTVVIPPPPKSLAMTALSSARFQKPAAFGFDSASQNLWLRGPTLFRRGSAVAKEELGAKRIDPETGRKFYDLNKDPIVSPYTGKSYPRSVSSRPAMRRWSRKRKKPNEKRSSTPRTMRRKSCRSRMPMTRRIGRRQRRPAGFGRRRGCRSRRR